MADAKISGLTAGTPLAGDNFVIERGGTANYRVAESVLENTVGTSLAAGTVLMSYVAPGTSGNVLTSDGTNWTSAAPTGGGGGASTPPGRLTLESGVPVSTTDQADKVTLYYTPMTGNQIMLYSGTAWETKTFAELSLNISAFTASKPYDIWAYNNAGTVTLDSTVWTNATTRATALAYQDGRLVKAGDATRLYLGTIYMDAASKCQDKTSQRFVWNYYNRVNKYLRAFDTTDSWNYTTNTWRAADNNTTDGVGRFSVICGVSESVIDVIHRSYASNTSTLTVASGIGINSTSVNSAFTCGFIINANAYAGDTCLYRGLLSVGLSYIQALEYSEVAGTTTWYGDLNKTFLQTGMSAVWMC